MNAQQAIDIATRDGFCHIGQHTHLIKTCEAAACIKLDEEKAPYQLVIEGNWSEVYPVKNANDKRLIKAIEERK